MWRPFLAALCFFVLIVTASAQSCPNGRCPPNKTCVDGQCRSVPELKKCKLKSDCSQYYFCSFGLCILDHRACGRCRSNEVCINGRCVLNPRLKTTTRKHIATTSQAVPPTPAPSTQAPSLPPAPPAAPTTPVKPAPVPSVPAPLTPEVPHRLPIVPKVVTRSREAPSVPPPPAPTTTPAPRICRPSWIHIPSQNACYLVRRGSYNYHQANFYCQSLGVHLVSIRNKEEMALVNAAFGEGPYWIGARKYNGIWFWQDGRFGFDYYNWRPPSEPDGCCGFDVSCVLVNYHTQHGLWEDAGCDEMHRPNQGFVCKEFL